MTRPAARAAIKRPGAGVNLDLDSRGKAYRLIRMREIRLLSRAQLAAKMSSDGYKITPDAIAKIENGYRRPKTSTLSRLCAALDCEPEDLLPQPKPSGRPERVPCPECGALFGHDSGCPHAT